MRKYVIAFAICGSLFAAKKPDIVTTITPQDMSRTIVYSEKDIPTVHAKMGYTTVFILPKTERVMDLLCGDKASWTINGADGTNFAYLKPEKAGARTNLNLVAASGNVYSFLLVEGDGQPDLKVFVQTNSAEMASTMAAPPKWVLASEMANKLEAAQRDTASAKGESSAAKEEVQRITSDLATKSAAEVAAFRRDFPSSLKHDYDYKRDRHSNKFGVQAMAHSDKFTYIWADPRETPTLYEVKDGKPSLINFEFANGVYVVPKVVDIGYLAVGKAKMNFKREE